MGHKSLKLEIFKRFFSILLIRLRHLVPLDFSWLSILKTGISKLREFKEAEDYPCFNEIVIEKVWDSAKCLWKKWSKSSYAPEFSATVFNFQI